MKRQIRASRADELRTRNFYDGPRQNTKYLLGLLDDGVIDAYQLAWELIQYMSDDEVGEFIELNDYRPEEI